MAPRRPNHHPNHHRASRHSRRYVSTAAGYDTQVIGQLLTTPNGSLQLTTYAGRQLPRVDLDVQPTYACTLVPVPASQRLGEQFLVRVHLGGDRAATVRLKDVERVACPCPRSAYARIADLTRPSPAVTNVPLSKLSGALGAMVSQP
jgi:hypothetical protein